MFLGEGMHSYIIYLILLGIILITGQLFQKSTIPLGLILVLIGMLLSFIPFFPMIELNHNLVLNIFLPLLVYQISSFSSWQDMKKQFRPIALLSIGHVVFITLLVAITIHALIPQIGWPIAFVLGAIISPPDSIAIVSIAERIRIPERIFIILEGEGIFNDAAALTLFRFALTAAMTNQISVAYAFTAFSMIIAGEIIYGLILGQIIGQLRLRISNTSLHVIASFLTPFLAYIPMVKLGGSGIIATAIVGFIIGNQYAFRFTPAFRLTSVNAWPMFSFTIQSLIFLLVGLDLRSIFARISSIPLEALILYVTSVVAVVILGRFIWVYGFVIGLPRLLFPSILKNDPYPPWQYSFIIAWAGIRGGISLAAALAIPALVLPGLPVDLRDLIVFLVFCVIFVTLILQGLSLPFILKKMGIDRVGQAERQKEHFSELNIRIQMINAAVNWLEQQKAKTKDNRKLLNELSLHISEYQLLKNQLESRLFNQDDELIDDEAEIEQIKNLFYLKQVIDIEKEEVLKLWRDNRINIRMRNKLITLLDHQIARYTL